ncbi:hypothetical protein C3V36_00335 [Lachnospiraceae bacterium oral taxon 500]|nr:hypothetical protein C3V36_00335 [Lachnospiraceae bacterium oral taxon 500]
MKQNKDQTQVLIWAVIAVSFLYILFRLKVLEDIGQSAYIPGLALLCLAVQVVNHEQAAVALRKRSPNFTNNFYSENGRMIIGNIVASALVLELNTFNYEQVQLNFALELISLPFVLAIIFLTENSRGGFLTLNRIYFPKQWDQFFKNYGTNLLSLFLMTAMWLPVILKVPVSALLWILISALLLKQSVIYTNKYNHQGWCFFLEGLLVLQLLTLGFRESSWPFIVIGAAAGLLFLANYMRRLRYEKGLIGLAGVLFAGGLAAFYRFGGEGRSMVFYIQWETALLAAIFVLTKVLSIGYHRWIRPEDTDKYSYDGAVVDKNWQESEKPQKSETTYHSQNGENGKNGKSRESGNQRPTLLKIKEKPQKVSLRLKAEEKRKQAAVHPPKPQAKPSTGQANQTKQAKEAAKAQDNPSLLPAKTKPATGQTNQEKQTKQPKQVNQEKQAKQSKQTDQVKETVKALDNLSLLPAKTKPATGQANQEKQANQAKPASQEKQANQAKPANQEKQTKQPKQTNQEKQVKQPKQTKKLKKGKAPVKVPANQPVVPAKTKSLSDWVNQSKEAAGLAVKPMTGQISPQITGQNNQAKKSNQPKKANQPKQTGKAVVQLPKSKANKHQEKAKTAGAAKEKLIIYPKSEIHLKQPVPPKAKKPAKGVKPNQQPVHSPVKAEVGGQAGRKIKYFRKKKSKKLAQSAPKE